MDLINKSLKSNLYNDKNKPLVTVFVWVYNNESYINDCLESIIEQITSFSVEIILHDDCSNDGTRGIINHYENKYPFLFNNILQTENQWSQGKSVMLSLYTKPKGKFVALMHGDDYWLDNYKLQKQVDFLEKNLDYSFCSTNIHVLNLKNNLFSKTDASELIQNESYHDSDLIHFLKPYVWYTCTVVFRKSILDKNFIFDKKIKNDKDIFLFSILLKDGKCHFMNEFTTVYRVHENGVWSTISSYDKIKKNNLTFGSMAYFHNGKVSLINDSFLWGLIDIIRSQESNFQDKFIHMFQFLFFCFYKPKYFPLFWKELIKVKLTKIMKQVCVVSM